LNRDCEALLELYGALQECQLSQQAEKKAAFDSALNLFVIANQCEPRSMRAFIMRKWNAKQISENRRKGVDPTSSIDPNQRKLDL
jgi:lipopolysaccharide biosynthesis regulator YciM